MKATMLRSIGRFKSALQSSVVTDFFCGIYFDFIFILPNKERRKKNRIIAAKPKNTINADETLFERDIISIITVAAKLFEKCRSIPDRIESVLTTT